MKKLSLLLFAVLLFTSINAQTDKTALVPKQKDTTPVEAGKKGKNTKLDSNFRKNLISVELLGNHVLYSLNYERIYLKKNNFLGTNKASAKFSFSIIDKYQGLSSVTWNLIYGNKYCFEWGIGLQCGSYYNDEAFGDTDMEYGLVINAGYRYQSKKGFVFKTGLCHVSSEGNFYDIPIIPYFAFGWSF